MELFILLKIVFSLLLVVGLMYGSLSLLKRWSKFGANYNISNSEIKISSMVFIDENNKIISLSNKQKQYILGINKNSILLIDKYENSE